MKPPPIDLEEVQIWDLLSAFDRLMKEVGTCASRAITRSPTMTRRSIFMPRTSPIGSEREGKLTLRQLIVGRHSRSEMIGVFLALAGADPPEEELLVEQHAADDEMDIVPAPLSTSKALRDGVDEFGGGEHRRRHQ